MKSKTRTIDVKGRLLVETIKRLNRRRCEIINAQVTGEDSYRLLVEPPGKESFSGRAGREVTRQRFIRA